MPDAIFIQPDGSRQVVAIPVGENLMEAALADGIAGVLGQCAGGITCSTCHCMISAPWVSRLPNMISDERDLLEYVPEASPNSRLICQLLMQPGWHGIELYLPKID